MGSEGADLGVNPLDAWPVSTADGRMGTGWLPSRATLPIHMCRGTAQHRFCALIDPAAATRRVENSSQMHRTKEERRKKHEKGQRGNTPVILALRDGDEKCRGSQLG